MDLLDNRDLNLFARASRTGLPQVSAPTFCVSVQAGLPLSALP